MSANLRLLITGAPGSGKTTIVQAAVRAAGPRAVGFTTGEIREGGERVGFHATLIPGGPQVVLAHRSFRGPRVGRYGVDVAAFEELVLPALAARPGAGTVWFLDEVGKMECFSLQFPPAVRALLDGPAPAVVATVPLRASGFPAEVKARPDVRLVTVTPSTREAALAEVLAALRADRGP